MDLSFSKNGFADRDEARLEYGLLVAALQSLQATSPAARAELAAEGDPEPSRHPMADLLLGAPGWRGAVSELRGSFNRAQAESVGKTVATQVTAAFTLAF